jgi:hypothetical protein
MKSSSKMPPGTQRVMNTTTMTGVVDLIRTEAAQLQNFMVSLDQAAWARPSTCTEWTGGELEDARPGGGAKWAFILLIRTVDS